jgi:hypothetical protein
MSLRSIAAKNVVLRMTLVTVSLTNESFVRAQSPGVRCRRTSVYPTNPRELTGSSGP